MFLIPSWALGAAVILIAIQVGRAISGRYPRYRRGGPEQAKQRDSDRLGA